MPARPRISIVTPSYNQGHFLENTILSVLEQGYPDMEYFVMDGGSTDGSVEIIRKYTKHITYWQSQPDGGQVNAINAGFRKATGDVFAFLNSDDFLLRDAIRHLVEAYGRFPQAAGWAGGGHSIAKDGFILQTRIPKKLGRDDLADWEENWIFQPACFFSASAARTVGFLNAQYHNSFDLDFWMRLAGQGELIALPEVLAAATVHPEAKTQKFRLRMFKEVQAIQRAFGYEAQAQLTQKFIDQAERQTTTGTVARLLYETHAREKAAPGRFVRFPAKGGHA